MAEALTGGGPIEFRLDIDRSVALFRASVFWRWLPGVPLMLHSGLYFHRTSGASNCNVSETLRSFDSGWADRATARLTVLFQLRVFS